MHGFGAAAQDNCPFTFNHDAATFKAGDCVSYRVSGGLAGTPFVGTLVAVHEDHVILETEPNDPSSHVRATRESRPLVAEEDI